jgi:hypothetical protein
MTPFSAFILTDAVLLGLLVCSLIWLFKTSAAAIWLKVALAVAFGILVCWSPLATRAILGYPQPRAPSDLPDRFQLLAEHSEDDRSFDLWIESIGEHTPLSVTVVPNSQMRSLLRSAQQKLGEGAPVFFSRDATEHKPGAGRGNAGDSGGNADGAPRTNLNDDQTRWTLNLPTMKWRKDGD